MHGKKKGDAFKNVGDPILSLDGKHVAYHANSKFKLVLGKQTIDRGQTKYGWFGSPNFSKDGRKVAFALVQLTPEKSAGLWWKVVNMR